METGGRAGAAQYDRADAAMHRKHDVDDYEYIHRAL